MHVNKHMFYYCMYMFQVFSNLTWDGIFHCHRNAQYNVLLLLLTAFAPIKSVQCEFEQYIKFISNAFSDINILMCKTMGTTCQLISIELSPAVLRLHLLPEATPSGSVIRGHKI